MDINTIIESIDSNIAYSPIVFFFLLILAGFNIPISEDAIVLMGGILSSRKHEYTVLIFLGIFWGAYLGDIISFYIGKLMGNKLFKNKKENNLLDKINYYYGQYGILTLFIGRFIPFGVRNAIFISAGMGNMKSNLFIVSDFFATLLSTMVYFTLSFKLGQSFEIIFSKIKIIIFTIFITVVSTAIIIYVIKKNKKVDKNLK
ncbi:DedA family protein [Borreliella sinica]|uniref:DedA family protein n=1 Tax=Borreliella sinica TaxID=87162 RepID=UPI002A24BB98|nr:DedA family protein [Borreliella sinica]WPM06051.1 DedA family protein [Borreliella sinica]